MAPVVRGEGFPTDCSLASWQARGFDKDSVVADPMIASDWSLLPDSPALKLGFVQLDVEGAGPRAMGPAPAPAPAPAPPPPPPLPPGRPQRLPLPGTESDPSDYDQHWLTPSTTGARGQLPLGNGDCSASVWIEPNGDLLLYAVKSDSFDELSSRDKLARLRVRLEPPLRTSAAATFSQHLHLRNASVVISDDAHSLVIYVDANAPALRLRARSLTPFTVHASLEVWRSAPAHSQGSFCTSWNRSADVVISNEAATVATNSAGHVGDPAIGVAHPNPSAVSDALVHSTLQRQGIDMQGNTVYNPMRGLVFGAWVTSSASQRVNSTTLSSRTKATDQSLLVTMLTLTTNASSQEAAAGQWAIAAAALAKKISATSPDDAAAAHTATWINLWNRSFVRVAVPAQGPPPRDDDDRQPALDGGPPNLVLPDQMERASFSTAPTYLGCFADCKDGVAPSERAMPHNLGNLQHTDSPAACAAQCRGWAYIGLQDGQNCYCGNSSGYKSQGPSVKCAMPCSGNASVICGACLIHRCKIVRIVEC